MSAIKMKLFLVPLSLLAIANAFSPPVSPKSFSFGLRADPSSDSDLAPHPPLSPPPPRLLDNQNAPFFLEVEGREAGDPKESEEVSSTPSTSSESEPVMTQKTREEPASNTNEVQDSLAKAANSIGEAVVDELIKPMIARQVEKGVPVDIIKGAAVSGASLAFLSGQSFVMTGAAAAGVAYLSITPGKGGDTARAVGDAAWQSSCAVAKLYRELEMDKVLSSAMATIATSTADLLDERAAELEAEKTRLQGQQEAKALEEEMIKIADEARLAVEREEKAQQEKQTRLVQQVEEQDRMQEQTKLQAEVEEKAMAAEEARLAAEMARQEKEEARLAAEARQLVEEARAAVGAEEKARQEEEERLSEDKADDNLLDEEDWEASIRLAQEMDGVNPEIAAAARAAVEQLEAEGWDESQEEPTQDDLEELEMEGASLSKAGLDVDETDLAALGEAARRAVAMYDDLDESRDTKTVQVESRDWSKLTVPILKAELKSRGLKCTGKKAELVALLEAQGGADYLTGADRKGLNSATGADFKSMTVPELKEQLRMRGLKVSGKKADLLTRLLSS